MLNVEYLFGFWIVGDPDKKYAKFGNIRYGENGKYYIYFLAEQPKDEKSMWQDIVKWINILPTDYLVYHFADYERTRTKMLATNYGNIKQVDYFLKQLIDLSKVVQKSIIFPLYFYSIKDIAKSKFLNYKWRHAKAGGAQSIFWYEKWLETKDKQVLEDIINYNEDDVIATEYLHHWLVNNF